MPVCCGAKDLDLRTPACAGQVLLKRRVVGCRKHGCERWVARRVVSGVVGEGCCSKRCIGVRGGIFCLVWRVCEEAPNGIDAFFGGANVKCWRSGEHGPFRRSWPLGV